MFKSPQDIAALVGPYFNKRFYMTFCLICGEGERYLFDIYKPTMIKQIALGLSPDMEETTEVEMCM